MALANRCGELSRGRTGSVLGVRASLPLCRSTIRSELCKCSLVSRRSIGGSSTTTMRRRANTEYSLLSSRRGRSLGNVGSGTGLWKPTTDGRGGEEVHSSVVTKAKPDIGDRIIASVPYLLPLLDGLRYGRFFFQEFPQVLPLIAPLQPLIKAYYTLPFASLVVFFALYYGVVNNYNFSRFVRYNAMQTILLDILLIIPSLIENFLLRGVPKTGGYLQLTISFYNFVWLYVFICFLYGVGSCLAGEQARLPGVADAADRQGPM